MLSVKQELLEIFDKHRGQIDKIDKNEDLEPFARNFIADISLKCLSNFVVEFIKVQDPQDDQEKPFEKSV
jgi:hypothetical protein